MKKIVFLISCLLANVSCATSSLQCSDNWYVTGYYTPIENEFSSPQRSLRVKKVGKLKFDQDFIGQVKIEGWGKTRFGWYLGYYSNAWHKSPVPLDAKGGELILGTIATDPRLIASGQSVMIPGLHKHLHKKRFIAKDVGRNIRQRRIDVYTGEGRAAKQMAYRLTKRDRRVCM